VAQSAIGSSMVATTLAAAAKQLMAARIMATGAAWRFGTRDGESVIINGIEIESEMEESETQRRSISNKLAAALIALAGNNNISLAQWRFSAARCCAAVAQRWRSPVYGARAATRSAAVRSLALPAGYGVAGGAVPAGGGYGGSL
jgi:hypothetical protein